MFAGLVDETKIATDNLFMLHILKHESISEFLKSELKSRQDFNPAYSLRAFARDLTVSPSALSEILQGKKSVSKSTVLKISQKLKLSMEERNCLLILSEPESRRSEHKATKAREFLETTRNQKEVTLEVFELISKWHHFTILEAFKNKYFREHPAELREILDINEKEFQLAVDHLIKLKLIDLEFKPTQFRVSTPQDLPSSAIRMHHKSILRQAEKALESQEVTEREFQTSHLIFSKENLPKIKQKIRNFQNELIKEFGQEEDKLQDVYCLSIQFFNLTKKTLKEGI